MRLGSFLIYCGRTRDATPYIRAALDQDPVDPRKHTLLWAIHMANGDLEAAQAVGQRIVDLGWPSIYLAVASAALGQHDLAIEQYQLTKALVNSIILPPVGSSAMTTEAMDSYWLLAAKGVCSGQEADRQLYAQWLEVMFLTLPDCADLAITAPAILTGNAELTFKALESRISPANMLALVALWADVDPIRTIREHPGFMAFAERIGMVAAWEKYGWPDALAKPGAWQRAAE
jgi:tetratricopeptide (TPR) repeat protein